MTMPLTSANPATGKPLSSYPEHSDEQIGQLLQQVHRDWQGWRRTPLATRAELMRQAGRRLREQAESLARLMAQEMGKPIAQGRSEVEKCAWVCEYYADQAAAFLQAEPVATDAAKSYVSFEPLGVILAVMPWNFPFWQVFRAAAPALMAGNAVVLKHASNVTGCALAIERLLREAGLPEHLLRVALITSSRVATLIEHPLISGITLTGSSAAGSAVAALAGRHLKKTVLELGGSDPYLIFDDADLEPTVEVCVNSRLLNNGQSCIAAKRFIVMKAIRRRFEQRMVELMRARIVGDPLDETVQVGPLARHDLRDALHDQVVRSVKHGATALLGAAVPDSPGAYYPPTVLSGVTKGMPAFDEETFGPVAAVIEAADEADAVRLANDSSFGLGAAVFTRDLARGEWIAATELQAGCCFVNAVVRSDPRLPFGGVKQSGYGRELSVFGIREFVNIKTVYMAAPQ